MNTAVVLWSESEIESWVAAGNRTWSGLAGDGGAFCGRGVFIPLDVAISRRNILPIQVTFILNHLFFGISQVEPKFYQ